MVEVKGKYYLTITAEADEIYHIKPVTIRTADIYNLTDEDILVSLTGSFEDDEDGVGEYITIGAQAAANGQKIPESGMYIKAGAAGKITIKGAS